MQAPNAKQVAAAPELVQVTPAQLAGGNPVQNFRAAEAARSELRSQLDGLEGKRREFQEQLRDGSSRTSADKAGMETRIADIDKRIGDVEKQIAAADQVVARAAGVPGAVVEPPRDDRSGPLPEAPFIVGGLFIVVALLPISLAFARRIWRRGNSAVVSLPHDLSDRLSRLDQAVDSIAVEVERIGEGQRFVTRVLSENGTGRALGSGAAMPLDVGARDKARVARHGEPGAI